MKIPDCNDLFKIDLIEIGILNGKLTTQHFQPENPTVKKGSFQYDINNTPNSG